MIKVGIFGATGYGGCELVRFLLNHPNVEIKWVSSRTYASQEYSSVYKNYFTILDQKCVDEDLEKHIDNVDVIFFATPQGVCASHISKEILQKVKVIDLSADFRLSSKEVYEYWYGIEHPTHDLVNYATYGLSEIYRDQIKDSSLVANPGCYTTCAITSLYPLVKAGLIDASTIIVDGKSGVTGAGRSAKVDNLYCEVNESIKAYGVTNHRHTPEIEEQLSSVLDTQIMINFTPHLVPMNRGIITTSYAALKPNVTNGDIDLAYKMFENDPFVRVLKKGVLPETRNVKGSNYIDINYVIDNRTNRIVVLSCLDNLVKGAAGQAIQNMNIMFGIEETKGLELVPVVL